ncbi:MAG: cell surface protein SprA, partial [Gemmatimonadaceae bacterium]|nr:cell surface protein SprA [Gemmatimonadaceae bacterium]
TVAAFTPLPRQPAAPPLLPRDTTVAGLPSRTLPGSVPVTDYADLALKLNTRLELKGEKAHTAPCLTIELAAAYGGCRSPVLPSFNFQFNVLSGGVVADRVHVDVDYDSQREFDASNNLSIYYQGKPNEVLQRLEVGNVTFAPPPSRFLTAAIPSGNYGVQALGQVGPMRFRAIAAQQKGQLVHDARFTVGDRTQRSESRDIDDYQIEPRRFFFTVDPALFAGYPKVDILNQAQLRALRAQLAPNARPTNVRVYRLQIGSQPANPNGPRFIVNGLTSSANRGEQPYELLREGVDYYMDPSLLWFALVRQPSLDRDRIVVAYNVDLGAGAIDTLTGGTPDVRYVPVSESGHHQYANLVYDHSINPGDAAFRREIRSVYRIGGEEVRRNTINLRIVAGAAGDQEKPSAGSAQTYLQMLGLAQPTNPAAFDAENRVWPRPSDPNVSIAPGGGSSRVISDYFVVLPSVQPFTETTRGGRIEPGNLTNDPIYTTPDEYLYSTQHPTAVYRLQLKYQTEGSGDPGSLMLGAVQLRRNSERLTVDGVQLVRDLDYTVDYELGRVTFTRPDTLFPRPRTVTVQYEENPVFQSSTTNVFGIASTFSAPAGEVTFTAMAQGQKTLYNRPPLGFEPMSSLVAGVSGSWSWDAPLLTNALARIPMLSERPGDSRIALQAEIATSHPQPNSVGQAWIENFAGEGGIPVSTLDPSWFLSSRPLETPASNAIRPNLFDPAAAASLVWQTNVASPSGVPARFFAEQVDPSINIRYNGTARLPEQVLWLSLLPDTLGWQRPGARWLTPHIPAGARRWRSIRTVLSPSGADLTQVEQLEFFAMVDTRATNRDHNPTLIIDLGDVSENTLALAPDSLVVPGAGVADSTFKGRRIVHLDTLDTERDPITRVFSAALNDVGIAPDVVDSLKVVGPAGSTTLTNVPVCQAEYGVVQQIGDQRNNCTVHNSRLDEEDIDLDFALNYTEAQRANESFFRYTVDLAALSQNPIAAPRGRCFASVTDSDTSRTGPFCWIRVRVPLDAARDTVNSPLRRRIKALRLTMVAGATVPNSETITTPIARFKLAGPLWRKRADAPLAGIGGDSLALATGPRGTVSVTTISTQDPGYVHPPGLGDDADTKVSKYAQQAVQTNERSLRVIATSIPN